jgi:ring-1,2-phenylacetyl-CoA epoxidase subunit PaaE
MSSFHKLSVKNINKEANKAISVAFEVPEHLKSSFAFKAGQYITLKKDINGNELRRDYSICSSPKSGELKVAIKEVKDGTFSSYANNQLKDLPNLTSSSLRYLYLEDNQFTDLPSLSGISSLTHLSLSRNNLENISPERFIGLSGVRTLILSQNKIKELPQEIGNLKKLRFLNLNGNPLVEIPSSIKYLDASNGGSLLRLGVNQADIGEKNYKRLQELLPTTPFGNS